MKYLRAKLVRRIIDYFGDDDRRVEHALCVLQNSERLMANHSICDPEIVISCALLHDVGIKVSENKHGYNNGWTQEKYGPEIAEELLRQIEFPDEKIKVVKDIIGNHHSVSRFDYPELSILKDADHFVNRYEKVLQAGCCNRYDVQQVTDDNLPGGKNTA